MDSRVIFTTLILSAIAIIGWTWLRSRREEEDAPDHSIPRSRSPRNRTLDNVKTPDNGEVRAKPQFDTTTTTQHLQHDGIDVYIISSVSECDVILSGIPKENFALCGFDCEWSQPYHLNEIVEAGGGIDAFVYPVALVQIATMDSRCYLIRLGNMDDVIPQSLVNILVDEKCLKFGVNVLNDLNRLKTHYLIQPRGAVDLRHLARDKMLGSRMGLQALSKHFLGIDLNKDPQLQRSNWQCQNLSFEQIIYAAMDAKVSLNILLSIVQLISKESFTPQPVYCYGLGMPPFEFFEFICDLCTPFIDVAFAGGNRSNRKPQQRRANNPGSNYRHRRRNLNTNRTNSIYRHVNFYS